MGHRRHLLEVIKIYCLSEKCLPQDVIYRAAGVAQPSGVLGLELLVKAPEKPPRAHAKNATCRTKFFLLFWTLKPRAAAGILCCNQLIVCSGLRAAFYT